jgi:hypothetical protein
MSLFFSLPVDGEEFLAHPLTRHDVIFDIFQGRYTLSTYHSLIKYALSRCSLLTGGDIHSTSVVDFDIAISMVVSWSISGIRHCLGVHRQIFMLTVRSRR